MKTGPGLDVHITKRTALLLLLDIIATYLSYWLASILTNVKGEVFVNNEIYFVLGILAFINVVVLATFRLYNNLWEYASIDEVIQIVGATVLGTLGGAVALVGGGIGTAPLLQLAAELAAQGVDVDLYAGFRDEPYRVDAFSAACRSVHIATDSGRHGHHGFVTDLLDPAKYTAVCTCGPEIMMEKVAKMCLRAGVRVYVSREAKMACGVGACLGCTCKSKNGGVSVCKDGPVFEGSVLYELD